MAQKAPPPEPLPDPVRVQDVRLVRTPWGFDGKTSVSGGQSYPDLTSAVEAALAEYVEAHLAQESVSIRAGTGAGAVILGIQGILLLKAAIAEGAQRS